VLLARLVAKVGGAKRVQTVFDVGAHDGGDSLPIARAYPHMQVIAIEPTPALATSLREAAAALPNYRVVEAAVGENDGRAALNVYDVRRINSINSLYPLSNEGAARFGRSELPNEAVTVRVLRLDSLCDELGIDRVDVLHIDAQGSDLPALRSLGRRLEMLRAGAIEAPFRAHMYANAPSAEEIRTELSRLGFRVFRVERMDWSTDLEHNYLFMPGKQRLFAAHLVAAEARALVLRDLGRHVERIRAKARIRTRLRRLMSKTSQ